MSAPWPRVEPRALKAASSPCSGPMLWPWKAAAATVSIAMLITPATPIAMTTSQRSKRKIFFCSSSVAPTTRRWVSAEWR